MERNRLSFVRERVVSSLNDKKTRNAFEERVVNSSRNSSHLFLTWYVSRVANGLNFGG